MKARFAASPIGPGLALPADGAGVLLTTSADALDLARIARSDVALDTGTAGVEFAFYSDQVTAVNARVGLLPAAASLSVVLGTAAATLGWDLATGKVYVGGIEVATGLPVPGLGQIIGLEALLTAGQARCYVGTALVATVTYAPGAAVYFAAGLASTLSGDLTCVVNSGQWQALTPAARAGWEDALPAFDPLRLADYHWLSAPTDTPANARWEGWIDSAGLETYGDLAFWPWGGFTSDSGGAARFRVLDPAGVLDAIALDDLSGQPVTIMQAERDGTLATATPLARMVLDRVEISSEMAKAFILRDAHDDLDTPINPGQFLPNIPALAWRAMPAVIGAVASVPVLASNFDGSAAFLADAPVDVATVLDRGDTMEPGTWGVDPSAQQIILDYPPAGPMTADASSIGLTGSEPTPGTLEQVLRNVMARIRKENWHATDAAAIDTATGYAGIGLYAGETMTARQAMTEILSTYGASWWQDADGSIRITRVTAPEGWAGALAFDLNAAELEGDLVAVPDEARWLTRRAGYRPNARPLTAGEFVTDMMDVPAWRRNELMAPWRGLVYSGLPLARRYRRADTASPVRFLFWRADDAQTELDRVLSMYATERFFYPVRLRTQTPLFPGQVGRLTAPRFGLEAGRLLMVRTVRHNRATGAMQLTLWG